MNLNYEPTVLVGLVAALALFLGFELTETQLAGLLRILVVLTPFVSGLVSRFFTRSKASLRDDPDVPSTSV